MLFPFTSSFLFQERLPPVWKIFVLTFHSLVSLVSSAWKSLCVYWARTWTCLAKSSSITLLIISLVLLAAVFQRGQHGVHHDTTRLIDPLFEHSLLRGQLIRFLLTGVGFVNCKITCTKRQWTWVMWVVVVVWLKDDVWVQISIWKKTINRINTFLNLNVTKNQVGINFSH